MLKLKTKYLPESQKLWKRIRTWQKDEGITDLQLASLFELSVRTLKKYDKSARSLKLDKLDNFFERSGCSILFIEP